MYHFNLLNIGALVSSIATIASGNPVSKRGMAQDVIADINAINSGVQTLTADTAAFNGGNFLTSLVSGTPVLLDVVNIHLANRKGYLDATTAIGKYSASDSTAIVNTVSSTVAITIPNSVDVLKSKKATFQSAGQVPVVIASLELLLSDHDTFSAAVLNDLTVNAATLVQANAGIAVIHNALESGIAYFETA